MRKYLKTSKYSSSGWTAFRCLSRSNLMAQARDSRFFTQNALLDLNATLQYLGNLVTWTDRIERSRVKPSLVNTVDDAVNPSLVFFATCVLGFIVETFQEQSFMLTNFNGCKKRSRIFANLTYIRCSVDIVIYRVLGRKGSNIRFGKSTATTGIEDNIYSKYREIHISNIVI